MHTVFFKHLRMVVGSVAAFAVAWSVSTPAVSLDARQAFAFMVAAYEATADQCNYSDGVRRSIGGLNERYEAGDAAGWADLKSRGSSALDQLEGIMPLNMEWTSCSSVGGMLADWAAIATVTMVMEADTASLATEAEAVAPLPGEAGTNELVRLINEAFPADDEEPRWTYMSLHEEVQGGCAMTTVLATNTKMVAIARPGDTLQLGIATTDPALLKADKTVLAFSIDDRLVALDGWYADRRSLLWLDLSDIDQLAFVRALSLGKWLNIDLNGASFSRKLDDFAAALAELSACSDRSLERTSANLLLR